MYSSPHQGWSRPVGVGPCRLISRARSTSPSLDIILLHIQVQRSKSLGNDRFGEQQARQLSPRTYQMPWVRSYSNWNVHLKGSGSVSAVLRVLRPSGKLMHRPNCVLPIRHSHDLYGSHLLTAKVSPRGQEKGKKSRQITAHRNNLGGEIRYVRIAIVP